MKIDSYSNIIETNELLFQEVQNGAFESPVELVKYNTLIKLMELQLKAIEKQKKVEALTSTHKKSD